MASSLTKAIQPKSLSEITGTYQPNSLPQFVPPSGLNVNLAAAGDPSIAKADPVGTKTGSSSAGVGMAIQGGQAVGQGVAAITMGLMQNAANDKARKEARQFAEITRQDQLAQRNEEFSLSKRSQKQQEDAFKLQKRKDDYDSRFNRFVYNIKKALADKEKRKAMVANFNSPQLANAIQRFQLGMPNS